MEQNTASIVQKDGYLFALPVHTVLHERYDIIRVIGSGGFSITYQAMDTLLGGPVAIKEFFPQSCAERSWPNPLVITRNEENRERFRQGLERFRQEARHTAAFQGRHNTVSVIDFCEENGTAYLVMEYLDGMTLDAYLRSLPSGRLENLADAQRIAGAAVESLVHIHKQGGLHRDISPDNIFLCSDGSVRVIDFGASRWTGQDQGSTVVVKTGCTPPEQYQKRGKQGPWTDIYAWGATFYRMLTGVFPDASLDRLHEKEQQFILASRYQPGVPEYIDRLLERCLALDYRLRPGSAAEVLDILRTEQLLKPSSQVQRERRRRQTLLTAGAVMLSLLLAAAGILAARKTDTLYHATISDCVLSVEVPEGLSSPEGLSALEQDFEEMYPQVDLCFSTDGGTDAAVSPGAGQEALTELRQLLPEGELYEEVIAYDATLLYGSSMKAASLGLSSSFLLDAGTIPEDLVTDSYMAFIDPDSRWAAFRGSVSAYGAVQKELLGLYTVCADGDGLRQPVGLGISDGLDRNTRTAAMRFLLYLSSERAQEILFVEHRGLLPSNEAAREKFFQINDELRFLEEGIF